MTSNTPTQEKAPVGLLEQRYSRYASLRLPALDRAREAASLTIPMMMPPEGFNGSERLPTPWQSVGARGVNNLAAKLLLTLFPPNAPFFRYTVPEWFYQQHQDKKELRAETEKALSKIERTVQWSIEASKYRVALFEALRQLLVAGNALVYTPEEGGMQVYRLDRYVVKRDPMGSPLEIILYKDISWHELGENAKRVVSTQSQAPGINEGIERTYKLYTCVKRMGDKWMVWQEIAGQMIPESMGSYPIDRCPWLPLRYIAVENQDYGRGFVEEYLGDLKSLEGLTKAIVQGSAAAAKVLFLVKANGSTKIEVLTKSESGDVRAGNAEDVTVLQMQKFADFQVAQQTRNEIKRDLELAFLLNSAIQRQGERVTAEEIRYMANELENSLGGVYSNMSQELQLPIVVLETDRLTKKGRLPVLPKDMVKPVVTTGVEAMGRSSELQKLRAFLADLAQLKEAAEAASPYVNVEDLVKRLAANHGIDTEGLIPTDEQIKSSLQQQQQMGMMQQLGPNIVNALGGVAKERVKGQVANQQSGGNPNG